MITRRNFIKNTIAFSLILNTNLLASNKRIKTPLLKNKNGDFEAITWKKAYDIMENKISSTLKKDGVNGIALYTNPNLSIEQSYTLNKLFKAGFRSNNILIDDSLNKNLSFKAKNLIYGINSSNGQLSDILNSKVVLNFDSTLQKYSFSKNTNIINISTNYEKGNTTNIFIQKDKYQDIISYFINEFLNSRSLDMIYLKRHTIFANYKNNTQWEISFKNYKKSFEKYTLEYLINNSKNSNQNTDEFKQNILKAKDFIINKNLPLISLASGKFNNTSNALEQNLLLESMHILFNKHSRKNCGVFNISNNLSHNASINLVGLDSNRLAANMYIKYNQHQKIANRYWNIVEDTLNPISNTKEDFISNINNNITKVLWIQNNDKNMSLSFKNKENLFKIYSSSYLNEFNNDANLILPTATFDETSGLYGDDFRQIKYQKQKNTPSGLSMSILWQTIELSKRFNIDDLYKRVKINNTYALKDVKKQFILNGFKKTTSLFDVLFNNDKLKLFKKQSDLNTEVSSDKRAIIGSDGGIFYGYNYNIQEYLFEELRQFTINSAFDLPHYRIIINSNNPIVWPYINDTSVIYRFNTKFDPYTKELKKKNLDFVFYGKMDNKSLPFGNLEKITNENKKSLKYRAKIFTIS